MVMESHCRLNLVVRLAENNSRHWFDPAFGLQHRAMTPNSYALLECTVSPGFEYDDWDPGQREALVSMYPQHRAIIERLTR
jgi:predicted cupin superfamily sugar epimerase